MDEPQFRTRLARTVDELVGEADKAGVSSDVVVHLLASIMELYDANPNFRKKAFEDRVQRAITLCRRLIERAKQQETSTPTSGNPVIDSS